MFHVPNEFRVRDSILGSDDSYGNNGFFIFKYRGREIRCQASDGCDPKYQWEHVSVTIDKNKTPSWEIMCFVKDLFWDEEDCVIQYHPPKSSYVNMHPYCLHLWRKINFNQPIPETIQVGIK